MFPSPHLESTSAWIHWLTVAHQDKPKDSGNAKTAWCHAHQPSSLEHQAKIWMKVGLVSQDGTQCHEEHKLFAWQATRAHVDGGGGAFRSPIRAIATLLPAGLVLNGNACTWPGAPSRSNMFQLFSWPLPGLGLHASQMWNQDCRFYNPLPLQWQDLQRLGCSRSWRDKKPETLWHIDWITSPSIWPRPTSFTSLLSTIFWVISPSCNCSAGYPGFCAGDRPVARCYCWCPGHLSEAQFLPLKCESVCCTIAMHPPHNHCPHLQKKRWENCCRTSLTCGALVLLKTAFPWCWPGANKGRETEQRILQHPKPANCKPGKIQSV